MLEFTPIDSVNNIAYWTPSSTLGSRKQPFIIYYNVLTKGLICYVKVVDLCQIQVHMLK